MDPDKNYKFLGKCEYIYGLDSFNIPEPELSVIHFNIRSIRKNFEQLTDQLNNSSICFYVITLTETWLDENSSISDYALPGYHPPIIQNREDRSGGGVLIYLRQDFKSFKQCNNLCFSDNHNNFLTIEASKNNKTYCISACYRSPSSDNTAFFMKFEKVVVNLKTKNSVITGDFNVNLLNVNYHEPIENFYNFLISNSFKPVITKPTRITDNSCTLIDHIWINDLTNDPILSKIMICDITDHLPVMYIKCNTTRSLGYTTIKYRPLTENNINCFKNKLLEVNDLLTQKVSNNNNIDTCAQDYFNEFSKLYDSSFPIKTKKIHNKT